VLHLDAESARLAALERRERELPPLVKAFDEAMVQ
jgi:hypothetical protein